jgi:hypothetical protein
MGRAARWPARMAAAARSVSRAAPAAHYAEHIAPAARASRDGLVYRRPPPWTRVAPRPVPARARKHAVLEPEAWPALPVEALELQAVPSPQSPDLVPALAHGLSRVLRQRGVHTVGDLPLRGGRGAPQQHGAARPRSTLQKQIRDLDRIPQPNEINWDVLPPYITASKDRTLRDLARAHAGVRYSGSTSSMTTALSALYHAVSNFKDTLLLGGLTKHMAELPCTFTKFHKHPTAIAVRPYPETASTTSEQLPRQLFSIDSHAGPDTSPSILRDLGHAMERMLTMPGDEFREKILLKEPLAEQTFATIHSALDSKSHCDLDDSLPHQFYHYSVADSFLLRAQIDCKDDVTGNVFDVKTRAVAPIRYDLHNYLSNTHRVLHRLTGLRDSYEREFYDMVRSVFLKYALQLRIGRMSGAFVAYHNTSKMLGFEFVTLEEIEAYVFGSKAWTAQAFSSTIRLLGLVLDEITSAMPVSHPDYLKVVIAVHYSQRLVQIYAQRVRVSETDPLCAEKFESVAVARSQRRQSSNLRDFDAGSYDGVSSLESPTSRRGVSVVTSDSIGTDMNKLASISRLAAAGCTNISHIFDPKLLAESELLKCTTITPGDLCAWELSLAHFVNDIHILEPIELHSDDKFELRYRLERSQLDDSQILKNYIGVLSNAYYPKSAN